MIKYVAKFVSKEEYADQLLQGQLYMRPAKFFRDLEREKGAGQGDAHEGEIFPDFAMFKNIYYPIYCLYTITQEDIVDGKVVIDKQVVEDFGCEDGFVVIIDFEKFDEELHHAETEDGGLLGSKVKYGQISRDLIEFLIKSDTPESLRIKKDRFKHQKEYRIILEKNLDEEYPDKDYFICKLRNPIADYSQKVKISSLVKTEKGYQLNL